MALDPSQRSDWSELDLLTIAEATDRLDEEAAAVRREIETGTDPALVAAARHRLVLLDRAREASQKATVAISPGRVRTLAEIAITPGPPD